jgi:hydroxyethylthiazole kinase
MVDSSTTTPETLAAVTVAAVIEAVRAGSPLVHCITNTVVTNFTANALLAVGAAPAMVDAPEESGTLASVAGALLINLGTVTNAQADGMRAAINGANAAGVPWVLDPVAIGALEMRTGLAREFARMGPAVIRGNASEIGALAGGAGGRGVDSTADVADVAQIATQIATEFGAVVAMSGAVDLITDGTRTARVVSGNPMLTRVTGVGCALGALIGACLAVRPDGLTAAMAATSLVCVAGDEAVAGTKGVGSFALAFLDALDLLSAKDIGTRSGVSMS